MKYIRTKDGIYEVESTFLNNNGKWIGYNILGDDMVILREQVIAQADTIEELCDEFVVYHKYEDNSEYYGLCRKDCDYKHYIKGDIIYGAIWTNKGLIYVAKMNDKGELELI